MGRSLQPLPDALGAAFTAAEARAIGLSSRRLNHDDVTRIAGGLYVRARILDEAAPAVERPAATVQRRLVVSALALGSKLPPEVFFSHRTAAAIWGLPLPAVPDTKLEIARFAPASGPRRSGLQSRSVRPHLARVVTHRGVRVTDPASTWAMLAPQLSLRDAVALGDAAIHHRRIPGTLRLERPALALLEELRHLASFRRPGAGLLRKILPLLSRQCASAPETHLRLALQEWTLPPFTLDHDVYDSAGRLLGCSEIAFPEYRLALEYEGSHHLTDPQQWDRDIEKYSDYSKIGWEVIRVTSRLLYQRPMELRDTIIDALQRKGWRMEK